MIIHLLLPFFTVIHSFTLLNEISEAQVIQAEESRYEAIIAVDITKLSQLLADEFTYIQPVGIVVTKTGYLENTAAGNPEIVSAEFVELNVEVYDGFATSNGVVAVEVLLNNNKITTELLFLNIWILREGRLQLAARQSAFIHE